MSLTIRSSAKPSTASRLRRTGVRGGWPPRAAPSTIPRTAATSWHKQDAPAGGTLWSITFLDESRGWAAGDVGTLLATADGGNTWERQTVPTSAFIFGVAFADANHGWAVADYGQLFRTMDGGQTWTNSRRPPPRVYTTWR